MEAPDPKSSDASCLRCSGVTEESRRMRSCSPSLTYLDVTVSGAAKDNSLPNFARDFRTNVPQEPFRPTSKTLGEETAVAPAECGVSEESVSNKRGAYAIATADCDPFDMRPSHVALGEGLLR